MTVVHYMTEEQQCQMLTFCICRDLFSCVSVIFLQLLDNGFCLLLSSLIEILQHFISQTNIPSSIFISVKQFFFHSQYLSLMT